jgi:hypothetical protein
MATPSSYRFHHSSTVETKILRSWRFFCNKVTVAVARRLCCVKDGGSVSEALRTGWDVRLHTAAGGDGGAEKVGYHDETLGAGVRDVV